MIEPIAGNMFYFENQRSAAGAVVFFRAHAGYCWDPKRETEEQGRERCARDLATAERDFYADPDTFVVWEVDDEPRDFGETEDGRLYVALLCRDAGERRPDVIRGYDPRDGIFERPGVVLASLGGIDFGPDHGPSNDPYARVIVAELYSEFQATQDAAIIRGEN